MYAELQIGNDPATWFFEAAHYDTVAAGLEPPGAPLEIKVVAPLAGQLMVNPRAAGSVTLQLPVKPVGWTPSGIILPRSLLLYVSSAAGPSHNAPGYTLAAGYELATLAKEIISAMTEGTVLTVRLESGPSGRGVLALSGATLAYAVLSPAVPQA